MFFANVSWHCATVDCKCAFYNVGRATVSMGGKRKIDTHYLHACANSSALWTRGQQGPWTRVLTLRPGWKKNTVRASHTNFHNLISDHDENCILPLKLSWKITSDNLPCLQRKHDSMEADPSLTCGFRGHHSSSAKVSEPQERLQGRKAEAMFPPWDLLLTCVHVMTRWS